MTIDICADTWFVTGNHRVRIDHGRDSEWRPPGLHHARRVGEGWTRCGLRALEWPIFWEMTFSPQAEMACPGCAHGLEPMQSESDKELIACG